jgi:hypothetical protein
VKLHKDLFNRNVLVAFTVQYESIQIKLADLKFELLIYKLFIPWKYDMIADFHHLAEKAKGIIIRKKSILNPEFIEVR